MKLDKDVRLLAFHRRGDALVLYLATPDGVEEVVVGREVAFGEEHEDREEVSCG
jgi:hypothetical protein